MDIPVSFIELMAEDPCLKDTSSLVASLSGQKVESIRYNKDKPAVRMDGQPIPWCEEGVILEERPSYTLDPLFHAGVYYVQEASSMFISHVVSQISKDVNFALDLCAAPGGKTTLLLDALPANSLLVANETIKSRSYVLAENVSKWGRANCIVTQSDPKAFSQLPFKFDLILVDAPCSGEGMFRKDPAARDEWSMDLVDLCSARQKRILSNAVDSLAEGGILLYSTCTFNSKENIENVEWMVNTFQDLSSVNVQIDPNWNIDIVKSDTCIGYQFRPDKVKGEGFFISVLKMDGTTSSLPSGKKTVLRKPSKIELSLLSQWINFSEIECRVTAKGDVYVYNVRTAENIEFALSALYVISSGVKCGKLNKQIFIPDHNLALSKIVSADVSRWEVDKETARLFLAKRLATLDRAPIGWLLITYMDHGLGWVKNLGNRINNYLPAESRIRMEWGT